MAAVGGATIASAQLVQPIPGMSASSAVDTLSAHLRTLAANPRNLSALLGAGQSAIEVGDPNAALGFFARAEEIDPRNGMAKAGLASALVLLEKPDDALRLFGEASALGVPEATLARDRGLAYDLRGDNRRAQRDYQSALRGGADDEVTRRYALSLGISGDRAQAMMLLDPLLRRQDQAAWRARAFILAMNNDVAGANVVTQQVMPAGLASSMSPFLARLATLGATERAHAVTFGTMPSDGRALASTSTGGGSFKPFGLPTPNGPGDGLIPAGAPLGRTTVGAAAKPAPVAPRKPKPIVVAAVTPKIPVPEVRPTPGFTTTAPTQSTTRLGTSIAAVNPVKPPPEAARPPVMAKPPPEKVVHTPVTIVSPLPPPPPVEPDAGLTAPQSVMGPPADAGQTKPRFEIAAPITPAPPPTTPPGNRLASILQGIEPEPETAPVALPSAAELRNIQRAAARKSMAAAQAAAALEAEKAEKAKQLAVAKANPARLWVQVATGNNERGLATTWRKIREANATLLKPYGGYSVAFKATNRILAGPVKSAADARTLVNALGKAGVSATTFSSEAGQEVAKLAFR